MAQNQLTRIKLDAPPIPDASWRVWTKNETDKDAIKRFVELFGKTPTYLFECAGHLWAGPIPTP